MKISTNKGISLIELLVVVVIISIMVAIIIPSLSTFRNQQALKNTTEDVISLINKARQDTLSSLNSTNYGVHFESTRAVYFSGPTFTEPNSNNKERKFNSLVKIPTSGGINLNGGGSNIIFTRLTGDTSNYGTIVIQLSSNVAQNKIITINKTGTTSSN